MGRGIAVLLLAVSTVAMVPASPGGAADPTPTPSPFMSDPRTGGDATPALSPPLASLAATPQAAGPTADIPRRAPHASDSTPTPQDRAAVPLDPLIDPTADRTTSRTPGVELSFDGTGNPEACSGCTPPDPNGDVGPGHYVQMVNATKIQIWDKSGNQLVAPIDMSFLWDSGPCDADAGDPIVLYDPLADRWLLAQFTGRDGNFMCFAVSTTPDPTDTYWLYEFEVTTGADFPDYFKLGVWPDGYYMSANEAAVSGYTAYAFEREKMLAGEAASWQKFAGMTNFLLPADLDGATPPPEGAPNPFYTFKDNLFHGGTDRLEIYEFAVDWDTPANSTFGLGASVPMTPFMYTACGPFVFECIPQGGTDQRVDQIGEWPMWRFPYRNFGGHEAVVGTFSVGGGTGEAGSAIRWFELRRSGAGPWTLHQEGTHDLGDGLDRWMGSIAMDGSGGIALGYSASSSSAFPSIRYATRLAADPLGTLGNEVILHAGGGAQTASDRWGDYAAMVVDPANDCTFWFTSMYYAATSATTWSTRVGTFTEPSCPGTDPPISITKVADATDVCDGDTVGYTIEVTNNSDFFTWTGSVVDDVLGTLDAELTLGPGANQSYEPSGSITGTVTNTVTADGAFDDPFATSASDTATDTVTGHDCTISITKVADETNVCDRATVGYTIEVTNNSDFFTWTGSVVDDTLGILDAALTLGPGANQVYEPSGSITGTVTNTVTADGAFDDPFAASASDTATDTVTAHDCPMADDATFTVSEDAAVGTVVGTVTATDGAGGPVTFAIGDGSSATLFAIDAATGVITTAAALDYESTAEHTLTIVVSEGDLSSTATIVIVVTDVFEIPTEATFIDVPVTDPFFVDVEWLAWRGITRGCNPPEDDRFCPVGIVTRGQIAAFLRRALEGIVPVGPPVSFIDDDTSVFEADIEWLGATGITRGCNPPLNNRFCPTEPVTRKQLAAFLRRALG